MLMRIEDIDTPRVVAGASSRILRDLAWLGLDWDEAPLLQSARTSLYEAAIARLDAAGWVYACDCSRAEIARAASAPHLGEEIQEGLYPGTCRDAPRSRAFKRPPALRLRVPKGKRIVFDDLLRGRIEEDVHSAVGDFVLRRGDGVFAYQLVAALDDAETRVTHVVRADDLLSSTPRQILLMRLLGFDAVPTYVHVPLVVTPAGERLAKRSQGATVRDLAERGVSPETIVGVLARGLGLVPDDEERPLSLRDVAARLTEPVSWRKTPWPLPPSWGGTPSATPLG